MMSTSTGEADPGVEDTGLDSAGWVSLLSFSWLNPLFKTGAARQLRSEDLPGLAREDQTASWADRCDDNTLTVYFPPTLLLPAHVTYIDGNARASANVLQ